MTRDLRPLFDPRSVAIVGASNDPLKWGYGLARGALRGAGRRPVFLVNRNGGEIQGHAAHRSLAELPETPELVVVAVPEQGFEDAVDGALSAGARAIVGITAGLGEMGSAGRAREQAIVARVREAGAVLLGPNCLGVFDAGAELDIGWEELPGGSIGLISQSGNLALELALIAADHDLGFSRFASLGNQADLEAADLVGALAAHETTRVIAIYLEDFRHGRAFATACRQAVLAGTPVVLLAAGRSSAGLEAARSHTGALVGDLRAVDAAARDAGIHQVSTPKQLIDVAQALLASSVPRGRRLAVFGDGGGHCVVAADLADASGFELPRLSETVSSRLAAALGPTAETRNPVDFAGGGEQDLHRFELVARALLGAGEVDAALLTGYFGGYAAYGPDYEALEGEVARGMALASAESGRPLAVHTMYPHTATARALRAAGVPVYREIEAAVSSLARVAENAAPETSGIPVLPPPGPRLAEQGGYFEARELLEAAGIPFARARRVRSAQDALEAAGELGYPVVLKALGHLHKSDAGGVALGLETEEALAASLSDMATRLSPEEYSVERTAPVGEGVELIVGSLLDHRFGPIALVGLGGIHAELLADVAVALAPVDEQRAEKLVRYLAGSALLLGARGRPQLDLHGAARALAALSHVAAAHPEIREIEINPLLVTRDGALGLDARIVREQRGDGDAR